MVALRPSGTPAKGLPYWAGSFAAARDAGRLRTEGRDYVVADGEVITIKFTP